MKKRIFTEIGWGNPTFLSTETEFPDGTEVRCPGLVFSDPISEVYIRYWVGKRVFIASSKNGLKVQKKTKRKFKVILGFC